MLVGDNHWYEIPERWVDAADIQTRGKASVDLLRDMIVNRHTEYSRFKKLFYRSLSNSIALLPRQRVVIDLANKARQMGLTETTYIAEHLGINRHSAYKALRRAEERLIVITYQNDAKMETFSDIKAIYDDTRLQVSQDEIDRIVRGRVVTCQTQPYNSDSCKGHARAYYGICRPCYETFTDQRQYPDGIPDWVQYLINANRKEQRETARQDIIERRTKRVDINDVA